MSTNIKGIDVSICLDEQYGTRYLVSGGKKVSFLTSLVLHWLVEEGNSNFAGAACKGSEAFSNLLRHDDNPQPHR